MVITWLSCCNKNGYDYDKSKFIVLIHFNDNLTLSLKGL